MEDLAPFDAAVTKDPGDALALLSRGKAFLRVARFAEARIDLEKALTLEASLNRFVPQSERGEHYDHPEESDCHLQLAAALVELGELELAEGHATRGIELRSHEPAYTARGAVRLLRGDLSGAKADLERALEFDPSSARALRHRASYHERQGDLEAAEADLARALVADPFAEPAHQRWVDLRKRLGKPADALRDLPLPTSFMGRYLRGVTLVQKERYRAAIDSFSAALELDPNALYVLLARGHAYSNAKEVELALADFRAHEARENGSHIGPFYQGYTLTQAGRHEDALPHFARALERAPNDCVTLYQFGRAHAALAQHEVAIVRFDSGIETASAFDEPLRSQWLSPFWLERGKSRRALGREEEARSDFEAVLSLTESHAEPQRVEARALLNHLT